MRTVSMIVHRWLFLKIDVFFWCICIWGVLFQVKLSAKRCGTRNLLRGVKIIGSCGFQIQEYCNAKCEIKGSTIWVKRIRCLNNTLWSSTPRCQDTSVIKFIEFVNCDKLPIEMKGSILCLKIWKELPKKCPKLKDMWISTKACSLNPGSNCIVSCGSSHMTLKCLPNGTWSHTPNCMISQEQVCPKPKFGSLVNCSLRQGEKCQIRCPNGKIMNEMVICLPSGIWTLATSRNEKTSVRNSLEIASNFDIVSKCNCSTPNITENFDKVDNCNEIKIGGKCHLKCRNNFSLIGSNVIHCSKTATWSPLPLCSNKTCPVPVLPQTFVPGANCSKILSGQHCQVKCKSHGTTEAISLTCINGTHWSNLPKCPCPPINLSHSLENQENCSNKKPGEKCKVICKNEPTKHLNLHCQNNSIWSNEPHCTEKICSEPFIPNYLDFNESCSNKKDGELCSLKCKFGGHIVGDRFIKCKIGKYWSSFPSCTCSTPPMRNDLEIERNCDNKKTGNVCKIKCRNKLFKSKEANITCQNDTTWSPLPLCVRTYCEEPKPPFYLKIKGNCSAKTVGKTCEVICQSNGSIIGVNTIKCTDRFEWSSFPFCTCFTPPTRNDLELERDCDNKKPRNVCKIKCRNKLFKSKEANITCQNDTTWSPLPLCVRTYCEEPRPPFYLKIKENCSAKTVGKTCEVICQSNGSVIGKNIIKCTNKFEWSPFPSCTCSTPPTRSDLELEKDCDNKKPGNVCQIKCRNKLFKSKEANITCQNDTTWSPLPLCVRTYCEEPKPPFYLKIEGNCSAMTVGESCKVICESNGSIIGGNGINCTDTFEWSSFPSCACPIPHLNNDIEIVANSSCNKIKINEKCFLKCKNSSLNISLNFIQCTFKIKWSKFPTCSRNFCKDLHLPQYLYFINHCSSKVPGDSCDVGCKKGGVVIGNNTVKCINKTTWSKIPHCACPKLSLEDGLVIEGKCENKQPLQMCKLKCKPEYDKVENPLIICQENFQWTPQPKCKIKTCPNPLSPLGVLKGNCTNITVTNLCSLHCAGKRKLVGNNTILCQHNLNWSELPKCTCPEPHLSKNLVSTENCSSKIENQTCELKCVEFKRLIGANFITCNKDSKWTTQPSCLPIFCPEPILPSGILSAIENCRFKKPNEKCYLKCDQKGDIDTDFIFCINGTNWSKLPNCTCPIPKLNPKLSGNCTSKKIGDRCKLRCKGKWSILEGSNNYITCENSTTWSSQPICYKIKCPDIIYGTESMYKGRCINKFVGNNCTIHCRNGGKFVENNNSIKCQINGNWTNPSLCYCKKFDYPYLIANSDCAETTLPNSKCQVKCKNGTDMKNKNYVTCDNTAKWNNLPSCESPRYCFPPKLPIGMISNCSEITVGNSCVLNCENNAKIFGSNILFCKNETVWGHKEQNFQSHCVCTTEPKLNRHVVFKNDCARYFGSECSVTCENLGVLFNGTSVKCLRSNSWTVSPICGCSPPKPRPHLNFKLCLGTFPGTSCRVSCYQGIITKANFHCNLSYEWEVDYPQCRTNCTTPELTDPNLKLGGKCDYNLQQNATLTCKLECTQGFVLNDPIIKCWNTANGAVWSDIPRCVCPPPSNIFTQPITYDSKCDTTEAGDKCRIICNLDNRSMFITCGIFGNWTNPGCKDDRKRKLVPSWITNETINTRNLWDATIIRSKRRNYFAIIPRNKSHTCGKSELSLNGSCLYFSKALRGTEGQKACKSILIIKNQHLLSHQLISWFSERDVECVWLGFEIQQKNNTARHRDSSLEGYVPQKRRKYVRRHTEVKKCSVMLSERNYDPYFINCKTSRCHFVCKTLITQ